MNQKFETGTRVRFKSPLDLYPHTVVLEGETGIVTNQGVKLDRVHEHLDERDNVVLFDGDDRWILLEKTDRIAYWRHVEEDSRPRAMTVFADCSLCEGAALEWQATGQIPFGPRHRPSERCRSGKRPHCSCDTCF